MVRPQVVTWSCSRPIPLYIWAGNCTLYCLTWSCPRMTPSTLGQVIVHCTVWHEAVPGCFPFTSRQVVVHCTVWPDVVPDLIPLRIQAGSYCTVVSDLKLSQAPSPPHPGKEMNNVLSDLKLWTNPSVHTSRQLRGSKMFVLSDLKLSQAPSPRTARQWPRPEGPFP